MGSRLSALFHAIFITITCGSVVTSFTGACDNRPLATAKNKHELLHLGHESKTPPQPVSLPVQAAARRQQPQRETLRPL